MESKRTHIYYLDYLRLFAAAAVVYMHTAAAGLRGNVGLGWHGMNLVTSLAFTAVPLFFMISGFLLLTDERTLDPKVLLRRRLPRLVVPLAAWSVVSVLWDALAARNLSLGHVLDRALSALYAPVLTPFWFMYTLIALYVLSPLLCGGVRAMGKSGRRYVLVLAGVVSLKAMIKAILPDALDHWLAVDLLTKLQALGGYMLIFLLGYELGTMEKRISDKLLAAVAVVTYAVIVIGTWQLTVRRGEYTQSFQAQAAGFEVLLAVCLFLLAKQNLDRDCVWLHRIPAVPLLLPVYFMHGVVLRVFSTFGIDPMHFPGTVGCTLLNLLICYFAMKTVATIKPLCYLFTGMSYEKACASCNWVYTARRLRAKKQPSSGGEA